MLWTIFALFIVWLILATVYQTELVEAFNYIAKKKVAVAEGDAQAKRIQADAEAYYNAQVASSLTPEMVQLKQVEKWDGKLPTYSGITNGMFSFK